MRGQALGDLQPGLGQVDLHAESVAGGPPRDVGEQLRATAVGGVRAVADLDQLVSGELGGQGGGAVQHLRTGLWVGRTGTRPRHSRRPQVRLDPQAGRADIGEQAAVPQEHVEEADGAGQDHLGHRQQQPGPDVGPGHPHLEGPDVGQPLLQRLVVAVPAQQADPGVGVRR